ncbi:MAG TPA: matrixin family metalloprotease [bacterium]|nr:matrixin family metalloprotease [bacterium]HQL60947.1 matrixin family metalloprotease [bacterium]
MLILIPPAWGAGQMLAAAGKPMYWGNTTVRYTFDPGSLGSLTASQARQLVTNAFQTWQNVETSSIRFQQSGMFNSDVTAQNVSTALNTAQANGQNPILFDNDGGILNLLLGQGASTSVLGLTKVSAASNGLIACAWVVFNGTLLGGTGYTEQAYLNTAVHEIGHFIGLDHCQLFRHLAYDGYGPDDQYIPVMFPTTTDDETERPLLANDDRVSVSMAYPESSFSTRYGEIQGRVLYSNGIAFRGVNVAARKVDDPLAVATTCVSDYLKLRNGSYRLAGLPPGQYLIWIEPIHPAFNGSSQVGPYSETTSGLSFTQVAFAEYYSGTSEMYDEKIDPRRDATPVVVTAGKTLKNIDILANINPDPSLESKVQILASGYPETGAIKGLKGYWTMGTYQFLFTVSGKDDYIRIQMENDPTKSLSLYLRREAPADFNNYDLILSARESGQAVYSPSDNPPLQTGRYFIAVVNSTESFVPYTITVTGVHIPEGDLNGDGWKNRQDLYYFSTRWWRTATGLNERENLVKDERNRIDQADLVQFLKRLTEP